MNNHYGQSRNRGRAFAKGQAAVELAGALFVLVPLLLAAADFGRLYYTNIEVVDAARAGAQYGSQSVITAANPAGMRSTALNDAPDLTGMTPTAIQCTCIGGSAHVAACPTSYCTSNPTATFVEVDTSKTFHTIVSWPGVPHSITLTGKAVMMVAQ